MSYIGSTPTTQSFIAGTDSFNGTGSATNFTLSRIVNSVNDIQVVVNNVVQYPPNYSVSGTTLTISPAPSSGTNNVYVRYLSTTLQSITVPGGSTVNGNFGAAGVISGYNQIGAVVSITGSTTLSSTAFGLLHQCSGTSTDYTVVLPAVSGNAGKIISFQMSTALTKLVTLDGNASETIDGATTRIMWAGETAVLYCDGTSWTKIGGKTIPMVAGQTVSGTQSIPTGSSTKKTLGTATGYVNCPSAMNDTTNSKITIVRAGNYLIQGCTRISNLTITTNQETLLYVNGAEQAITSRYATSGDFSSMICDVNYALSVSDYVELYARQYSGVNQTYLNNLMNYLFVTEIPKW